MQRLSVQDAWPDAWPSGVGELPAELLPCERDRSSALSLSYGAHRTEFVPQELRLAEKAK